MGRGYGRVCCERREVWVVVRRAEAERVWEDAVAVVCGGMVVGLAKGVQ